MKETQHAKEKGASNHRKERHKKEEEIGKEEKDSSFKILKARIYYIK